MLDVDVAVMRGGRRIAAAFRVERGATVLFGPSGVGKTTVLDMIAGLLRPETGHVRVGGRTLFDAEAGVDVPVERRRAGYVFQEGRLFPHLRVQANLLYGAKHSPLSGRAEPGEARGPGATVAPWGRPSTSSGRTEMDQIIAMLDIAELLDRWPRSLSGGEARRVAIGRALLSEPAFLLLDEPTASLDAERREEVLRSIERVRDGVGMPIVMVTHDLAEAKWMGAVVKMA